MSDNKAKRYDLELHSHGMCDMCEVEIEECETGDYVRYDAYEASDRQGYNLAVKVLELSGWSVREGSNTLKRNVDGGIEFGDFETELNIIMGET